MGAEIETIGRPEEGVALVIQNDRCDSSNLVGRQTSHDWGGLHLVQTASVECKECGL